MVLWRQKQAFWVVLAPQQPLVLALPLLQALQLPHRVVVAVAVAMAVPQALQVPQVPQAPQAPTKHPVGMTGNNYLEISRYLILTCFFYKCPQ